MKYNGEDRRNKRLRGRKVTAFISTKLTILIMFYSMLLIYPEALKIKFVILVFVGAILFNMLCFVSINSVDKFLSSKFFHKE